MMMYNKMNKCKNRSRIENKRRRNEITKEEREGKMEKRS